MLSKRGQRRRLKKTTENAVKKQPMAIKATSFERGASKIENEERILKLYAWFSPEKKKEMGAVHQYLTFELIILM